MFKKIISFISITAILININYVSYVSAVDTNESSTPWTIEKAEHLAKKALYGASIDKVNQLYNAGSASAAVNILFPSISGPSRTAYNAKMQNLLDTSLLIQTSNSEMREYYTFKKLEDPYEAKSKLFSIFEDTFSVDTINSRINYGDIEATHDLIYSYTLGNYKDMVKKILYNNGNPGDYSLSEYLDLLNQTNAKYPNENYAREILQLFLMLEYIPTESEDTGATRNYSEDDVAALAKILFGFESDDNTHQVTYNVNANTNTSVEFLDGDLKNGDSFPFYNSGSGTIDIQLMKNSIGGNNGLPDNTINYIFSKRENSIAMFLADKFYRFYIAENPSKSDLETIATKIIQNNFEIYPTVKWLLANDMMYSEKAMNDTLYKNPLELIIGTSKILGLNSDLDLDFRSSLTNLAWTPYNPRKIFGRDGFDDNAVFFNPYISNKWSSESSRLATKTVKENIGFFGNFQTANEIITNLENKIFLGKTLDTETRNKLINFLTHDENGNEITIDYENQNFINTNLQGVLYMMLNQPEYVLQSGYDIMKNEEENDNDKLFNNDNKVIFIKANGGLDWLHALIQKDEYSEYLELRGEGALTGTGIISLDDKYYMNSSLTPFKNLYDSNNLRFINRVGTPDHSRGHDSASRKITSLNNKYEVSDEGIFGHFIQNEDPGKTIVLGTGNPSIFRNGNYMGIGSSALFTVDLGTNTQKNYKINTLKDILENRDYIGDFGDTFKNSSIIDSVAKTSKENGGREGSGYNMQQRFTFLESLYDAGLGNAAYMSADGGYDTHRNQKDYLSNNLSKVAEATSDFFNRVKDKHNVTIVFYSEFGRTNKLNSSLGVDHGMGGGMFILSNNTKLLNEEFPQKTYGNLSVKDADSNWLGVGIDYRSIYSGVLKALYNKDISSDLGGEFNINSYIDNEASDIELLNISFDQGSGNRNKVQISFDVNDENFHPKEASYIKFEYGSDKENMYEYTNYYISRYMTVNDNNVSLTISNTNQATKYFYRVTLFDNQYNKKVIEGDFISPTIRSDENTENQRSTRLSKFKSTSFSGSLNLSNETSSGIILSNSGSKLFNGDENLSLEVTEGTYINSLESNGTKTWNGTFINPISIEKTNFISKETTYNGVKLINAKIAKIIKVGADELGISMKLNKKVDLNISNISNKNYLVLYTEDGINWNQVDKSDISYSNNNLKIKTDHFTYFAIIETNSSGDILTETTNSNTSNNSSNGSSSSGSSSTPKLVKDYCPYGDYSISYYDNVCGYDPYGYDSDYNTIDTNEGDLEDIISGFGEVQIDHEDKEMQKAYIELKVKEEEKAEVYEELFLEKQIEIIEAKSQDLLGNLIDINNTKKEILILLREKMSQINIGEYVLIHIKDSKLNTNFEKIGNIIIARKYSKDKTTSLFNMLNKIIIYTAISKLENIEITTLEKNKSLLKTTIYNFISLIKNKKIEASTNYKKEETTTQTKKETIEEKIKRINEKRNAINNNM